MSTTAATPLRAPYSLLLAQDCATEAASFVARTFGANLQELSQRGLEFEMQRAGEKAWHLNGRLIKLRSEPDGGQRTRLTLLLDQASCARAGDDVHVVARRALELLDLADLAP